MSSKRCIVYRCSRRGGYRLPVANELRSQWLSAIRWNIPLEPKKTAIICPTHFKDDDFEEVLHNGREKKYLKRDVVPSIFPWNSDTWAARESSEEPSSGNTSDEDEDGLPPSSSSGSSSSSSGDESDPEEVVLISSDEDKSKSPATRELTTPLTDQGNLESAVSLRISRESSPGCLPAKRLNLSPLKGLMVKKMRKTNDPNSRWYTSSSQSSSLSSSTPSPKPEHTKLEKIETTKDESDSDGSDCVLCEEPVENIDLTKDDEHLELISPSAYQLTWSDDEEANSELRTKIRGWVNDILAKKKSHVEPISDTEESQTGDADEDSGSSDCKIVERVHPTIQIESDESSDDFNGRLEPERQEEVINLDSDDGDAPPARSVSPSVETPPKDLPMTPPSEEPKELASALASSPLTIQTPTPCGSASPEASKDPNGPTVAHSQSPQPAAVATKVDLPPSQKRKRKVLLKLGAKMASKLTDANYRLVKRTEPGSNVVRFVIVKNKKKKSTPKGGNAKTKQRKVSEVAVDPKRAPVGPKRAPVDLMISSVDPKRAAVDLIASADPKRAPVDPKRAPVDPKRAPVDLIASADPKRAPVDPKRAPVEQRRVSVNQDTVPVDPKTAPMVPKRVSVNQKTVPVGLRKGPLRFNFGLPKAFLKAHSNSTQERTVRLPNLVPQENPSSWIWLGVDSDSYAPQCRIVANRLSLVMREVLHEMSHTFDMTQSDLGEAYALRFEPVLSYGIIYWGHSELADGVFDMQKRFVALSLWWSTSSNTSSNVTPQTFQALNILTLPSVYILHCLIFTHGKSTRGVTDDESPHVSLGAQFYQPLPVMIKNLPTGLFIKKVKSFLLRHGFFNVADYYREVKNWC